MLSSKPARFTAYKHIEMIPESYSTVYCRVFTKRHCGTDVCCAAHQPEGIFHFTQTLKLTSRCKEAYVSSLHIFRAYSYSHSSSGGQHSHSLCLPDQIGEDRRTPWLCPRDGERVREGEKCPLSQCHRERSWHSVYVTRPVRSGRPPAILTLIWSSCGWEHETLNKTAAMDPLPCQLALSVRVEQNTRIRKQTHTLHWPFPIQLSKWTWSSVTV